MRNTPLSVHFVGRLWAFGFDCAVRARISGVTDGVCHVCGHTRPPSLPLSFSFSLSPLPNSPAPSPSPSSSLLPHLLLPPRV
eukprot:1951856-Rhodomonas_salina.1